MTNSELYRDYARACLTVLRTIGYDQKCLLLDMACEWHDLAVAEAERERLRGRDQRAASLM